MQFVLLLLAVSILPVPAQDVPQDTTFGTTVVEASGFEGRIYELKPNTEFLPNLKRKQPIAKIYTQSLNIPPQRFDAGFAGFRDRVEWFAIEYTGRFWIENPGDYQFTLLSDDGSKLFIDKKLLIDNDGLHSPQSLQAAATFTRGIHDIRVEYFQGPADTVALVLSVTPPGASPRVFNARDFKPPLEPEQWKPGKISNIRSQANWP